MHTDWKPLPGSSGYRHTFAIGDVHGKLSVFRRALELVASLPRISDLSSHLILLGDLNDRGEDSLKCIDLGLEAEKFAKVDEKTYLIGNHEIFLHEAIVGDDFDMQCWYKNGGNAVLDELEREDGYASLSKFKDIRRALKTRLPGAFFDYMQSGNSHVREGDLIFVHAGIDPAVDQEVFLGNKNLRDAPWAWIRDDFMANTGGWDWLGNQVVVHGHTPIEHDDGSSGFQALSDRIDAFRRGEVYAPDFSFEDPAACDVIETHRRVNLDTGCGKFCQELVVGEFANDQYRLHLVE